MYSGHLQQNDLAFAGQGNATFADFDPGLDREYNIHEANVLQFFEHFPGFIAQSGWMALPGVGP